MRRKRVLDFHFPTRSIRRSAQTIQCATAGADESALDALLLEQFNDAVNGISLGNSAQVQFHARTPELNRPLSCIQAQVLVAHLPEYAPKFERPRDASFSTKSPQHSDMPARSMMLRSWISPHRPRWFGDRSARTSLLVSVWRD